MQILLIDDDAELGAMLREYLAGEGFDLTMVHNGEAGVEAALSGNYSAAILDIMLPRMGGIEVLRRIRQESALPVIMLTAKGDDIDRVIGLEMGADDYVPKPCYPRELVARLRAVLRRSQAAPAAGSERQGQELSSGPITLNPAQRRVTCNGQPLDLTASEFNLLEMLLTAGDRVVTKDEMSIQVLGRPREAYDRSIDVHVSNLRQKLHAATSDERWIETVRGVGYRIRQV